MSPFPFALIPSQTPSSLTISSSAISKPTAQPWLKRADNNDGENADPSSSKKSASSSADDNSDEPTSTKKARPTDDTAGEEEPASRSSSSSSSASSSSSSDPPGPGVGDVYHTCTETDTSWGKCLDTADKVPMAIVLSLVGAVVVIGFFWLIIHLIGKHREKSKAVAMTKAVQSIRAPPYPPIG